MVQVTDAAQIPRCCGSGVGHSCSSNSTPSPGTSTCCTCCPKMQKKKTKNKKNTVTAKRNSDCNRIISLFQITRTPERGLVPVTESMSQPVGQKKHNHQGKLFHFSLQLLMYLNLLFPLSLLHPLQKIYPVSLFRIFYFLVIT